MRPAMKKALFCGAVPFVALVAALPFVNRLRPVVLGLPFVLFWILGWVALTPVFLYLAERLRFDYATLGNDAGYIGAAGLARQEWEEEQAAEESQV